MTDSHTAAKPIEDTTKYWKTCSILLGIGLVLSLMTHTSPSSAHASAQVPPAWQAMYDGAEQSEQVLTVDGFENIEGELYFVLVNQNGEHTGVMAISQNDED
jgi:hypothetical protein